MEIPKIFSNAYFVYLLAAALVVGWIFTTPLLAMYKSPAASQSYELGKYICHQKISRSLCIFSFPSWAIGDCLAQTGNFRNDQRSEICADGKSTALPECEASQGYGFKFPVSARDMAIYIGALVSAIAFGFLKKHSDEHVPHAKWLILALIPMAIDGTTQALGWRESTNLLRFISGFLPGFAASFYAIPILNSFLISDNSKVHGWIILGAFAVLVSALFAVFLLIVHPELFS
ncbi:MAG: DUF2085 domain-containing protein [Candidatus Micrarchaeota archaeon]